MLGTALSASSTAKKMHVALEEEKRQEKLRQLSQPKKQGWFKPGTEALGSVSASTYGTRSGSSSQTSLPTESTARAGRRKSVTMMTPDSELEVGVGASTRYRPARRQSLVDIKARPTYTRTNSEPSMMAADCDSPVAPGMWGMPPLEVKIKTGMSESTGFRLPTDDISIASTSVASGDVALTFSPHSPSDVRSESCQLPTDGISVADSSIASSNAGLTFSSDVRSASLHSSQSQNQIVDALISGMGDDRMADITLVGRDGAKVRATKFVLACRSPVLQEKLYQDPTQVEVFIGDYGEDAIRAMKEYCHTGAIKGSVLMTKNNEEAARGLVELATLAKVYGFEPLYGEADTLLRQLINYSPWLATACFDSAGSETELMEEVLLQFLKGRGPDLLLETSSLKYMSQQRLLVLLDGLVCSDLEMLKYLEKWIEMMGATLENMHFLRSNAAIRFSLVRLLEDPEMAPHIHSSEIFELCMVESIDNASPIMEEESEENGNEDEDDEQGDDQMEIHPTKTYSDAEESPGPVPPTTRRIRFGTLPRMTKSFVDSTGSSGSGISRPILRKWKSDGDAPINTTSCPPDRSRGNKLSVSFGSIEIREHGRVLVDHPVCADGLGLGLDWKHAKKTIVWKIDMYENIRMVQGKRSGKPVQVLSSYDRSMLLMKVGGYKEKELTDVFRTIIPEDKGVSAAA